MSRFKKIFKNAWLIGIGTSVIGTILIDVITKIGIYRTLYSILICKVNLAVWLLVAVITIGLISGIIIYRFLIIRDKIVWYEKIGNYRFKDLYTILQSQNLPIKNFSMELAKQEPPEEDVLVQFATYINLINTGITLDSPSDMNGYLFGILCPHLLNYGLVEKKEIFHHEYKTPTLIYQTSALGYKFYSCLQKVIHL